MKKKEQQKQSTTDFVSMEQASAEGPITAFLALFSESEFVGIDAFGKQAVRPSLKPIKIHHRRRN